MDELERLLEGVGPLDEEAVAEEARMYANLTPRSTVAAHFAYALTSPVGSALPGSTVGEALYYVAEHYDLNRRELIEAAIRLHKMLAEEEADDD